MSRRYLLAAALCLAPALALAQMAKAPFDGRLKKIARDQDDLGRRTAPTRCRSRSRDADKSPPRLHHRSVQAASSA
jgi:hypothetical protein